MKLKTRIFRLLPSHRSRTAFNEQNQSIIRYPKNYTISSKATFIKDGEVINIAYDPHRSSIDIGDWGYNVITDLPLLRGINFYEGSVICSPNEFAKAEFLSRLPSCANGVNANPDKALFEEVKAGDVSKTSRAAAQLQSKYKSAVYDMITSDVVAYCMIYGIPVKDMDGDLFDKEILEDRLIGHIEMHSIGEAFLQSLKDENYYIRRRLAQAIADGIVVYDPISKSIRASNGYTVFTGLVSQDIYDGFVEWVNTTPEGKNFYASIAKKPRKQEGSDGADEVKGNTFAKTGMTAAELVEKAKEYGLLAFKVGEGFTLNGDVLNDPNTNKMIRSNSALLDIIASDAEMRQKIEGAVKVAVG